jgi:hypothetical protein
MTTTTDDTKEAEIRGHLDQEIMARWLAHESISEIAQALGLPIAYINQILKDLLKIQIARK